LELLELLWVFLLVLVPAWLVSPSILARLW
jgi:hypothetical protein